MLPQPGSSALGSFRTLLHRMVRSARLDGRMFESLREDSKANRQSIMVLSIAGFCFGIGFTSSIGGDLIGVLLGAVVGTAASIVIGFLWLTLTFLIGTRLLGGSSSYWGLARPLFFAVSPGPMFLLMLVPISPIPDIAQVVASIWIAISSVIAVKNGLSLDNQRSLIAFIIVGFVMIILYGIIFAL